MFGNAPKALWARWLEPDELNRIPLACRCLLVEEDDRTLLFETGIGAFFNPKLKERYGVLEERHVLLDSLAERGLSPADIDVVVLSHLHFDHTGGLLTPWTEGRERKLVFDRATFVTSAIAWQRARHPHHRDRASFIPELIEALEASGRLELVEEATSETLGEDYHFRFSEGHTPGMMLSEISMPAGPVVFAADLIPGVAWVHLAITMGYDRFPEKLIDEKYALLEELLQRRGRLFYTHDPQVAMSRVGRDERGRFVAVEPMASVIELAE